MPKCLHCVTDDRSGWTRTVHGDVDPCCIQGSFMRGRQLVSLHIAKDLEGYSVTVRLEGASCTHNATEVLHQAFASTRFAELKVGTAWFEDATCYWTEFHTKHLPEQIAEIIPRKVPVRARILTSV